MEHNCQNPATDNVGTGADSQSQVIATKVFCRKEMLEYEYSENYVYIVQALENYSKEGIQEKISRLVLEKDITWVVFDLLTKGESVYENKEFSIEDGFLFNGELFVKPHLTGLHRDYYNLLEDDDED